MTTNEKIDQIRELLVDIPDQEFLDLIEMSEGQINYLHPLKYARVVEINKMGELNKKIVENLQELKKLFLENVPGDE